MNDPRRSHRKMLPAACALLALLWLAASVPSTADPVPLRWYAYDEGMARQQNSGRKAVVTFTAEWCGYCEKMDRETFGNRQVADFLSESFVTIRVDFEQNRELAAEYGVRGVPDTWFVDETGKRISSLPGYVPAETFLDILHYVESDSYKTVSFTEYLRSR